MLPTKATLRREALAQRLALPVEEVTRRSEQLCGLLFQHFPVGHWRWLSTFLPLARRHEPDTWAIIRRVRAAQLPLRLAVPVVQADGVSLRHHALQPNTELLPNRWGIPEPTASVPTVSPAAFDAVLVPLLAFDANGQRVGYGGGFYDRFLAECRPDAQFIGLSVLDDAPASGLADVRPSDVTLHSCSTPAGVWRF